MNTNTPPTSPKPGDSYVQSFARGLEVIRSFSATAPQQTYGGGRYLFDTVKGSDFIRLDWGANEPMDAMRRPGYVGGRVIVDFNYAYNPSCAYDDRWVCPLAPVENHLDIEINAGELKFHP